jgi:hypothetical protein
MTTFPIVRDGLKLNTDSQLYRIIERMNGIASRTVSDVFRTIPSHILLNDDFQPTDGGDGRLIDIYDIKHKLGNYVLYTKESNLPVIFIPIIVFHQLNDNMITLEFVKNCMKQAAAEMNPTSHYKINLITEQDTFAFEIETTNKFKIKVNNLVLSVERLQN